MPQVQTNSIFLSQYEERLKYTKQPLSPEKLQGELDYWRSRKILQKMLDQGLISPDEFHKIDVLNRKSFSPKLAQLMARPKPKPVNNHIRPIIQQWLQEEKHYPAKQCYTARGIYNRLVDEYDYQGSESSVRRVVAELRQAEKETYIPLAFEPGTQYPVRLGERVRLP